MQKRSNVTASALGKLQLACCSQSLCYLRRQRISFACAMYSLVEVEPKAECGFCKFMKAGPCGVQFEVCIDPNHFELLRLCNCFGLIHSIPRLQVWENCVAAHKDDDFFTHCAEITLALKECVDHEKEYYGVLDEMGKEQEAKEAFEKEKEAAKAGKTEAAEKTANAEKSK